MKNHYIFRSAQNLKIRHVLYTYNNVYLFKINVFGKYIHINLMIIKHNCLHFP